MLISAKPNPESDQNNNVLLSILSCQSSTLSEMGAIEGFCQLIAEDPDGFLSRFEHPNAIDDLENISGLDRVFLAKFLGVLVAYAVTQLEPRIVLRLLQMGAQVSNFDAQHLFADQSTRAHEILMVLFSFGYSPQSVKLSDLVVNLHRGTRFWTLLLEGYAQLPEGTLEPELKPDYSGQLKPGLSLLNYACSDVAAHILALRALLKMNATLEKPFSYELHDELCKALNQVVDQTNNRVDTQQSLLPDDSTLQATMHMHRFP